MARRQRSGSEQLVFIPNYDVVLFSLLAYTSMESFRADWHTVGGEVAVLLAKVKNRFVEGSNMKDLTLLLETDASWAQDVGPIVYHLVEAWKYYQGKLAAVKVLVPCTFIVLLEIGHDLFSASDGLEAGFDQARYRERVVTVVHEDSGA